MKEIDRNDIAVYGFDTWKGSEEPLHDQFIKSLQDCPHTLEQICRRNLLEAGVNACLTNQSSLSAARTFTNASLDFVFLDASHNYLDVIEDITAWLPKMKHGAVLAGHDIISWPSVREAVTDTLGSYQRIDDVWLKEIV